MKSFSSLVRSISKAIFAIVFAMLAIAKKK